MVPFRSIPTLAIALAAILFLGWMYEASPLERPIYASTSASGASAGR